MATNPEAFKKIHQRKAVRKFHVYLQGLKDAGSYGETARAIHEYLGVRCKEDMGIQAAREYLGSLDGKEDVITLQ